MNKEALKNLNGFNGTAEYHRLRPFPVYLTDGTLFLAQNADCFWLMNEIAIAQMVQKIANDASLRQIQFWTLKPDGQNKATLICERDSGDIAWQKKIDYTDFPFDVLPEVKVWVAPTSLDGEKVVKILYLPSEH